MTYPCALDLLGLCGTVDAWRLANGLFSGTSDACSLVRMRFFRILSFFNSVDDAEQNFGDTEVVEVPSRCKDRPDAL